MARVAAMSAPATSAASAPTAASIHRAGRPRARLARGWRDERVADADARLDRIERCHDVSRPGVEGPGLRLVGVRQRRDRRDLRPIAATRAARHLVLARARGERERHERLLDDESLRREELIGILRAPVPAAGVTPKGGPVHGPALRTIRLRRAGSAGARERCARSPSSPAASPPAGGGRRRAGRGGAGTRPEPRSGSRWRSSHPTAP